MCDGKCSELVRDSPIQCGPIAAVCIFMSDGSEMEN